MQTALNMTLRAIRTQSAPKVSGTGGGSRERAAGYPTVRMQANRATFR